MAKVKKSLREKLWEIGNEIEGLSPDAEGHGYRYLALPKILSVLNPLLKEQRILLTKEMLSCTTEEYRYVNAKGNDKLETFALVEVEYTFKDLDSDSEFTTKWFQEGVNSMDKSVSSATTYCDRDFFISFFNIANTEADIVSGTAKETLKNQPLPSKEISAFKFKISKAGLPLEKIIKLIGKTSYDGLTAADRDKIIEAVNLKMKKEVL